MRVRESRQRVVWRIWTAAAVGNTIALASACVVLVMGGRIHVGSFPISTALEMVFGGAIPGYLLSLALVWVAARRIARRYLGWYTDRRRATPHDISRFGTLPRVVATLNLVYWTYWAVASLTFAIHVHGFQLIGWAIPKTLLVFVLAYVVGTALGYVLLERTLRPYVAAILPADVREWPKSIGVTGRLIAIWFVVAGAPFVFIGLTWIGLTDHQMVLGGAALRVWTLLGAFIGLAVFLIVGRTITVPLRRLEHGFDRVAEGDLAASVDIGDPGELGHLEAGFNNMVAGLRRLETNNADLQERLREQLSEVQASRVRIVEAADAERARIERNLHDGAQQRLLSLSFALRAAQRTARDGTGDVDATLQAALDELDGALAELRELARGIHPAILDEEGLGPALESIAERAPVAMDIDTRLPGRLPAPVEVTAYFVVAESLANIAKYADASRATLDAAVDNGSLRLEVTDDGKGGADPQRGSGLRGLTDRVAALGGELTVDSEPGHGTRVVAVIPCM